MAHGIHRLSPLFGLRELLWILGTVSALSLVGIHGQDEVQLEDLFAREEATRIEALARLIDGATPPAHAEQLVAKLMEPSWVGRHRARWCMAALMELSSHPDDYLPAYFAAQGWLEFSGTPPAADSPERRAPVLRAGREALSDKVWERCIRCALAQIEAGEGRQAAAAQLALERMEAPVAVMVPKLSAALCDPERPVETRRIAAFLIGRYGRYEGSVAPLVSGLRDRSPAVRLSCAQALGQLGQPYELLGSATGPSEFPGAPQAVKALLITVTDADPQVARAAMATLQVLGSKAAPATEAVVAALLGSEARLQDGLLTAMAAWGSGEALPAFAHMMASGDVAARVFAGRQLNLFLKRQARDSAGLDAIGVAVLPALEPRLNDDPEVVVEAARACLRLGSRAKSLRPALCKALETPGQQVHLATLFAAVCAVDPAQPAPEEMLLKIAGTNPEPAPAVRSELAAALCWAPTLSKAGQNQLAALAADSHPAVRLATVRAVVAAQAQGRNLAETVLQAVRERGADRDPAVRQAAAGLSAASTAPGVHTPPAP